MTTKKQTGLRIDDDLLKRLSQAAKADGRSVNQQVIYYIRKALDAKETA